MMEEQLFDLLEQKSFSELTAEEKNFVLEFMTEQEYQCQRKIMTVAPELKAEKQVARPLVLPSQKRSFWLKAIPLYQVGMGLVAACLAFTFLWMQGKSQGTNQFVKHQHVKPTERIKEVVRYDTIEKWNTKLVESKEVIRDTIYLVQVKNNYEIQDRALQAQENRYTQELNSKILESKNSSLKQDNTSQFIPERIALRN